MDPCIIVFISYCKGNEHHIKGYSANAVFSQIQNVFTKNVYVRRYKKIVRYVVNEVVMLMPLKAKAPKILLVYFQLCLLRILWQPYRFVQKVQTTIVCLDK